MGPRNGGVDGAGRRERARPDWLRIPDFFFLELLGRVFGFGLEGLGVSGLTLGRCGLESAV